MTRPQIPNPKLILLTVYFLLLAIPGVTWVRNQGWSGGWEYGLMRLAGLYAFTLIVLQVGLGAMVDKLRPVFGAGIVRWHIWQGLVGFALGLAHPVAYGLAFGFEFLTRTDNVFVGLGRLSLLIMIFSVLSGLMRARPWIAKWWRWIHRLNYVLLVTVWIHSWNLGSDARTFPMTVVYLLAPGVLVWALTTKLRAIKIVSLWESETHSEN